MTEQNATYGRPVDSALDRFITTKGDDARLALGLPALEAALAEARSRRLDGWEDEIAEYVGALRSGEPLNRPL